MTFPELVKKYLAWVKTHQSARTHEWYRNYLDMFCAFGDIATIPAYDLKPYHVQEWIDSYGNTWGANYKGGAIVAIKRVFNWAEEMGYGDGNPVKKLRKPTAQPRKIYMKADDFTQVLELLPETDPFRDFVRFVWLTGARPQEARHIEPRHVDLKLGRITFPASESKGKRIERVIHIEGESLEIIERLLPSTPNDSKVFRNSRNQPWTKVAVCNRFHRISQVIGKRMFCYAARHGFGTRKLAQKHDHLTVAALMGHKDGAMLAKVYSHINEDDKHLKDALKG